ncbi:ubiquitin family protein [Streptomyces sp. NPDC050658]|uniref:ubiquitin family protein n=1 Tax=unclassified Streptomyces TaxID=2593676 RepID=UPI0034239A24
MKEQDARNRICALSGTVTVSTPSGKRTTKIDCEVEAEQNSLGDADRTQGTVSAGKPLHPRVAQLQDIGGYVSNNKVEAAPKRRLGSSISTVQDVRLLGDLIRAEGLTGALACTAEEATRTAKCDGITQLGALYVSGSPVSLPSGPTSQSWRTAVTSSVPVTLGTKVVQVPVNGQLAVNEIAVTGQGATEGVTSSALHLTVTGKAPGVSVHADLSVAKKRQIFPGARHMIAAKMPIFVKTLKGKNIAVEFDRNDILLRVKEVIQAKEGLPPDQQRLIYAGKRLEDTQTFASYGIQPGATLSVVLPAL